MIDRRSENRLNELGMIASAFEFTKVNGVDGDYFEFGLWRGRTFCHANRMRRRYGQKHVRLVGFDSFCGLPATPSIRDSAWSEGQFGCSRQEFEQTLAYNGLLPGDYDLIEGYYEVSLNQEAHKRLSGRSAAIVYIDCDLYESTLTVLNFVHPYLNSGSIVCFDDWYFFNADPDQGEQKATSEFLSRHDEFTFIPYRDYGAVGKSFIVRR